jgi:hypothetical protein
LSEHASSLPAATEGATLSWIDLVRDYDPGAAFREIERGAIDAWLTSHQKVAIPFDDDRKLRFLRHYAATGRKAEAAFVAGISPTTVSSHAKKDPEGFGAAVDRAVQFFREVVIDRAAHKFAIEGWEEPVFYKGEQCGSIWKFCPRTFELYAKRMHPDYRERNQLDVSISGGVLVVPASCSSTEEWLAAAQAVEAKHEVLDEHRPDAVR